MERVTKHRKWNELRCQSHIGFLKYILCLVLYELKTREEKETRVRMSFLDQWDRRNSQMLLPQ